MADGRGVRKVLMVDDGKRITNKTFEWGFEL